MSRNDLKLDKCLVFDLKGPMAHFRKYYTNSSSLSYLTPPRTVIAGLIAGLLGIPSEKHLTESQESYYEKFNDDNCFVSISLRSPIRKMMQTVNYLRTKSIYGVDGSEGGTPVPLEILVPEDNDQEVVYRIYFYYPDTTEKGTTKFYEDLKRRLMNQSFVYPPYLGLSEFIASIHYID
ncbi:MAG: type I-B CRISPR-associated protein Cas5, partial [Candidatus Altiarchaeota archaeon]|nr:type I-B CRISPR-associated protein Cas5 [Candidatus Altiarchaeota archaeon]